ncbi:MULTISPECIES: hypothetical protein [Herbaspirillum]|uniref:Uncharacterized protein n=1 Tax=Herbaspirillum frisingense TaxID=92645 RepID=A0ABU1PBJ8_9BURK|nr:MULTISPECIES: hypothetical protein [Herbaspirillum]MDR6583219.1 hypothetical protein [Herbaspirillum frisingense]
MSIRSLKSKLFFIFICFPLISFGRDLPKISEEIVVRYRARPQPESQPEKYVLVHPDGSWAVNVKLNDPTYLLNIRTESADNLIYSREIDSLFKGDFSVLVDRETLLSNGKTDYVILTMSRPAENNPRYERCAPNMGEDRAYLLAISDGKARVVSKKFGGCSREYEVVRGQGFVGYRVTERGENPEILRYMIRGDSLVWERE